ncbi:substrate-binding domain-containing protein [Bacillus alkalicellulosilyticus]|uniref:substrate-binding domain-containing protein n=1 Tax=Alkalihalobacterium alkalicellulosilyticum TaxID=1912214 RepID=UPI000995FA44|nr:substrate-binding domain-containing protein [Bacillus alkalicellulosilyticus]
MSRKKVTMQQIADTVGVSKYVVSKTLNGKPGVKDKTREKILFVAKQLGYFKNNVNPLLQNEKDEDQTSFIMVVLPNRRYQFESLYWGKIVEGLSEGIKELNNGMVIVTEEQPFQDMIHTKGLKGIIGVGSISTEMLVELQQLEVPIILIDHEEPLITADSIFKDNIDGVQKVTNHLLSLGHKHLFFIGDIEHSRSFYDRWLGFRIAIEYACLHEDIRSELIDLKYSQEFKQTFSQWFSNYKQEGNKLATAFVCANDDIAKKVMEVLKENDLRIPEDCSITGFDNLDVGLYTDPSLTTVQVLKEAIGKRAVSKLYWRIANHSYPPEKTLVQGEVIIRKSVAPPK